MEANLFIKRYKAEGNKIVELEAVGDWEIDMGGKNLVDIKSLTHNVAPTGFNYLESSSTGTRFYFKNQTGRTIYYSILDNTASSPNQSTRVQMTNNYTASFTTSGEIAIGLYTDRYLRTLIGYIRFKSGDKPVEIEHY